MRVSFPAPLIALALAVPLGGALARAQDSQPQGSQSLGGQGQGDQRALDSLGSGAAAHKAPAHAQHHAHHAAHHAAAHATHAPAPAATPIASPPPIPAAPPPPPVFKAPLISVPLHPEPPPPPVPVVAGAVGAVSPIEGGSRITFGDGSADLNQTSMQALQAFTEQLKADPQARARIDAYGRGPVDDPSTPRRISLSRGLAARAVLINGGIPSTRIYVRAIGQPSDGGPADRIDITRSATTQPAPDQANPNPGASPNRRQSNSGATPNPGKVAPAP